MGNENKEFLLEEYKSKWEYIKHTEEINEKITQWYFLINGVLLAFLFNDTKSLDALVCNSKTFVVLLFLILLNLSFNISILSRKRSVEFYRTRLQYLEKKYCDYIAEKSDLGILSSFRTKFCFINIISIGIAFLFFNTLSLDISLSILFALIYFTLMIVLMELMNKKNKYERS